MTRNEYELINEFIDAMYDSHDGEWSTTNGKLSAVRIKVDQFVKLKKRIAILIKEEDKPKEENVFYPNSACANH